MFIVVGTGGNPRIYRTVEPSFKPETKRTGFYEFLEFYNANGNNCENEWDDDDNDNKTR